MDELKSSFLPQAGAVPDETDGKDITAMFSIPGQMKNANRLAADFHTLLDGYNALLEHFGMKGQVQEMIHLSDCYAQGTSAPNTLAANGAGELMALESRLKGAGQDLSRLESEGGCTAKPSSADVPTEDFTGALHQISAIVLRIKHMFGQPEQEHLLQPAAFGQPNKRNADPAYPSPSHTESTQ